LSLAFATANEQRGTTTRIGGKDVTFVATEDAKLNSAELIFSSLPHGASKQWVNTAQNSGARVVDLSSDLRPGNGCEGIPYGLTELARPAIKSARLVANPGCYPTSAALPLIPLLASGEIQGADIIIDAKSGVSGAGRDAKQGSLYAEVSEGIHAYGIAGHRHVAEIEQELSAAAKKPVVVNFTPHLMPMSRGILSSIYVKLNNGATAEGLRDTLAAKYKDEPFVRLLPNGQAPATRHVRGSNHCVMNVFADRVPGRAILMSAIDNLVKGASGQAVQNMNVMCGIAETTALEQEPLFP